MSIRNRDQLINALTSGVRQSFSLAIANNGQLTSTTTAILLNSGWINGWHTGDLPAATNTPATCDSATPGALALPVATRNDRWAVASVSTLAVSTYQVQVLDRLAQVRLDAAATTNSFTMTLPARAESAVGVNAHLEIAAGPGTYTGGSYVPPTTTVTYTNHNGVSGRTGNFTLTTPAALYNGQGGAMMSMGLDTGDQGVTSVQSVTFSAAWPAGTVLTLHLSRTMFAGLPGAGALGTGIVHGFYDTATMKGALAPCLFVAGPQLSAQQHTPFLGAIHLIRT